MLQRTYVPMKPITRQEISEAMARSQRKHIWGNVAVLFGVVSFCTIGWLLIFYSFFQAAKLAP